MFPIVVVSNKKTVNQLSKILSIFFNVSIATENRMEISTTSDLLIIRTTCIENLKIDKGFLVLSDFCENTLEECDVPIVIAEGVKPFFCEKTCHKTQYVTCGMSTTDTFSFSSIEKDEVVVSLMRELKKFDGEVVEPFEITVSSKTAISNYSPFCILCAVAVITFLGVTCNNLKLCLE